LVMTCSLQFCDSLGQRRTRRRARWGVLLAQEFLGFCRPRHQFAIQTHPVGFQVIPDVGRVQGGMHANQEIIFQAQVRKNLLPVRV
jgi:hypothetical protein